MGDEGRFGVCEVEDDNGNPFLKLEWGDEEFHGCLPINFSFYVGKKVSSRNASDEECGLTEDKQIRLGMVLTVKEVEELATKGYISSDSGSDEEAEISESKDVKRIKEDKDKKEDVKEEDVKEDVKVEDIKDGVKEEEAAHLKRRLPTDEKEEISSSEPKKKVHKAF